MLTNFKENSWGLALDRVYPQLLAVRAVVPFRAERVRKKMDNLLGRLPRQEMLFKIKPERERDGYRTPRINFSRPVF